MPLPDVGSLEWHRRRCFGRYPGRGEADERLLRRALNDYARGQRGPCSTFTEFLWHTLWELNGGGQTTYYLYWNDEAQRLHLDARFREWATCMLSEIGIALSNLHSTSQTKVSRYEAPSVHRPFAGLAVPADPAAPKDQPPAGCPGAPTLF